MTLFYYTNYLKLYPQKKYTIHSINGFYYSIRSRIYYLQVWDTYIWIIAL